MRSINTFGILENIQPFNSVFCRSCFYNSFFPVVNHFNRSIIPFLINDIFYFKESSKNSDIGLDTEYASIQKISQIAEANGIFAEVKEKSDDVEADIVAAVSSNRPVIIWCDPFYESIRTDAYYKKHLAHTLLIYGYSRDREEFNIIEHRNYENLSYENRIIGYRDIIESYHGFIEHFLMDKDFKTNLNFYEDKISGASNKSPTYLEFYHKDIELEQSDLKNKYIEEFYKNITLKMELIAQGMKCLEKFTSTYKEIIIDECATKEKAEELLDIFNKIVNAKKIESYKISLIMGQERAHIEILEKIEKHWTDVRSVIAKYIFSQNYQRKAFYKTINLLESVCQLEKEMFSILKN